jgi:hypothetical protein
MAKFRCTNCNYRFDVKPGKRAPNRCPYCAKEKCLEQEKTAQELLDNLTE